MIDEIKIDVLDLEWIDVQEPRDKELSLLQSKFDLPHLLVQDCLRPEHLPKFESTDVGSFLMLRGFDVESKSDAITVQEITRKIALFITHKKVITIHRVELPFIKKIREKVHKNESLKSFHDLIHLIIINTIKSYEEPLLKLQDEYDLFEEEILAKRCEFISTTKMYQFRRKLFVLKRLMKQTEEALSHSKDFWADEPSMLQDLRENCQQIYYRLDEISDTFEHLFQLYISLNDQRANEVMKVLTVFSTILLPLNFLASFYGMNFTFLPGLESRYAVHYLLGTMILISIVCVWYFNRRGWFRSRRD